MNDRGTRLLRELTNGDQCRDRAWRHRLTALVHYEAAVRVAIECHTGIRADFAHLRLQVHDVRRVEWVGLVVGEGAVELEVERDHRQRQVGEHDRGGVPAHAVPRVDDDA